MQVAMLHLTSRNFAGNEFVNFDQRVAEIVRAEHRLKIRDQKFLFRVAENLRERVIDLEPTARRRNERDADRRVVERAAESFFGFGECL